MSQSTIFQSSLAEPSLCNEKVSVLLKDTTLCRSWNIYPQPLENELDTLPTYEVLLCHRRIILFTIVK